MFKVAADDSGIGRAFLVAGFYVCKNAGSKTEFQKVNIAMLLEQKVVEQAVLKPKERIESVHSVLSKVGPSFSVLVSYVNLLRCHIQVGKGRKCTRNRNINVGEVDKRR